MRHLEVLQDVGVLDVRVDGADVCVDLYGSRSNICGSVRFTFEDPLERAVQVRLLRRWEREQTALTFVSHDTTVALTNDAALLAAAVDGAAFDRLWT